MLADGRCAALGFGHSRTIQGRAVVAGYPSELYDDLLSGWQRVQRPHHAAGRARARTEAL